MVSLFWECHRLNTWSFSKDYSQTLFKYLKLAILGRFIFSSFNHNCPTPEKYWLSDAISEMKPKYKRKKKQNTNVKLRPRMALKMAYGHYTSQTLCRSLVIHIFVKRCLSFSGKNSCLVFSVRLETTASVMWQTDRLTDRQRLTYSPGWLHTADTPNIHLTKRPLLSRPRGDSRQNISWCDLKPHLVQYKHFSICTGQSKVSVHTGICFMKLSFVNIKDYTL